MNKNEIDTTLKSLAEETEPLIEKNTTSNKSVKLLLKVSEGFENLVDLFDRYLVGLYGTALFENDRIDSGNLKGIQKRMFDLAADMSLNVGKLDDALSTDPPKKNSDTRLANKALRRIEIARDYLKGSYSTLDDEDRTNLTTQVYEIMEKSYKSLKSRIDEYNSKSEDKLQALKG